MSYLVSIDPGLRHCGVAVYSEVQRAALAWGLVKNSELEARGPLAHLKMAEAVSKQLRTWGVPFGSMRLAIEYPQIYAGSDERKGDLNDIVEVGGVVSAIVSWLAVDESNLTWYYPQAWKAQVPKKVMTERIKKFAPWCDAKDHNVLDAVGIGLFALGLMGRGGA